MGLLSNAFAIAFYELFMETPQERECRLKYGREYRYNQATRRPPQNYNYNNLENNVYQITETVANKVTDTIVEDVLPAVVNSINNGEVEEQTEYVTFTGNTSDYPPEILELDSNYGIIKLDETGDNNVFDSSLFKFRNNGPRFGCDVRLEPYYRIPMKFYENKWGDEIIKFTDILAGYIPLIEKIRVASRNPNLYFGLKVYNNCNQFMLSCLNIFGQMTDDIIITIYDNTYDVSWRRSLNLDLISGQTVY